ncbi:MAG: DUF547 domain-containing protein [Vicinamibacterales bacterium]|nr:DUF547 domain-containing protein [Vicinamibacterales bacterium]
MALASGDALGGLTAFDHGYAAFGRVLAAAVRGDRVDYRNLAANRADLDTAVAAFDAPATHALETWTRPQQLAFWINAYNAFTLQAIVGHYPIQRRRFSLHPASSIRQIPGVWDRLTWRAAGRTVTLDEIEHAIIRPGFDEPLIHFAVNCASVSCPPLAAEPYRAATLEAQLEAAAERYLASPHGLQRVGRLWRVSSLFKWYGDDFVDRFAQDDARARSARDGAIQSVIETYGPPDIRTVVNGRIRIAFIAYDWSLNDIEETHR